MAFRETLANQPCTAYICQMVIRFGLIPGAVDRDRQGCTPGGPTNSFPWRPRRDSDPDLSACKSERPTVRRRGIFERTRLGAALLAGCRARPLPMCRSLSGGRKYAEALAIWA